MRPFVMQVHDMGYYLYILCSRQRETYYIGFSGDPQRRCYFHNHESQGYTCRHRPWEIVFTRRFDTEHQARAAEAKVKSWKSKKMVRLLVEGEITITAYLE